MHLSFVHFMICHGNSAIASSPQAVMKTRRWNNTWDTLATQLDVSALYICLRSSNYDKPTETSAAQSISYTQSSSPLDHPVQPKT
jgi:hypothetical protein